MKKQSKIVYALIALSIAAYLVSLELPAIIYAPNWVVSHDLGHDPSLVDWGHDVLLQGALGLLDGNFAWLANALGLVALLFAFAGAPIISGVFSILAFAVGLDSLAFEVKPLDEGGVNNLHMDHLGIAFYVWEASFLLLLLSQLLAHTQPRRSGVDTDTSLPGHRGE